MSTQSSGGRRRPILELRHVEAEGPGAYGRVLTASAPVETVRLWQEPVPTHLEWSAVVVMGGPMGANDAGEVSWIAPEVRFLADAVRADVPVWGVCLGSQLLASALGARVFAGAAPEVGVLEVEMTAAAAGDPVWAGAPTSFAAVQWHGDTFDLPAGAVQLARSTAYEGQLFRYRRSYGVQFHLEADAAMAGEWLEIPEYAESLETVHGPGAAERLLADVAAAEPATVPLAEQVLRRWLELVLTPGERRSRRHGPPCAR